MIELGRKIPPQDTAPKPDKAPPGSGCGPQVRRHRHNRIRSTGYETTGRDITRRGAMDLVLACFSLSVQVPSQPSGAIAASPSIAEDNSS